MESAWRFATPSLTGPRRESVPSPEIPVAVHTSSELTTEIQPEPVTPVRSHQGAHRVSQLRTSHTRLHPPLSKPGRSEMIDTKARFVIERDDR